jgi:hypothetical protein
MFRLAVAPKAPRPPALGGAGPSCRVASTCHRRRRDTRGAGHSLGHRLRAPATRICHWSGYMRPGPLRALPPHARSRRAVLRRDARRMRSTRTTGEHRLTFFPASNRPGDCKLGRPVTGVDDMPPAGFRIRGHRRLVFVTERAYRDANRRDDPRGWYEFQLSARCGLFRAERDHPGVRVRRIRGALEPWRSGMADNTAPQASAPATPRARR